MPARMGPLSRLPPARTIPFRPECLVRYRRHWLDRPWRGPRPEDVGALLGAPHAKVVPLVAVALTRVARSAPERDDDRGDQKPKDVIAHVDDTPGPLTRLAELERRGGEDD